MPRNGAAEPAGDARAARGRDDPPPAGARASRGGGSSTWRCSTRAGRDPAPPEAVARRARRARDRAARPARQVPDHVARGRRPPRDAPAHDRQPAARRDEDAGAHTRVRFELDDGSELLFVDVAPLRHRRRRCSASDALAEFFASRLGVEPLSPDFTADALRAQARGPQAAGEGVPARPGARRRRGQHLRRRGAVPRAHPPAAAGGTLTRPQFEALRDAVVEIARARASTPRAPRSTTTATSTAPSGRFQDRFLVHLREGEPCLRCGNTIRKLRAAGRGTYVCQRCQPRPRA